MTSESTQTMNLIRANDGRLSFDFFAPDGIAVVESLIRRGRVDLRGQRLHVVATKGFV